MEPRLQDLLEALPEVEGLSPRRLLKDITIRDGEVRLLLQLQDQEKAKIPAIQRAYEAALLEKPGVRKVTFLFTSHKPEPQQRAPAPPLDLAHIQKIVAVVSGKGGVGKSMVATNLAFALAAQGLRVGLLDLDIYGPSLPLMTGCAEMPEKKDGKIVPLEKAGVKLLSMGMLMPQEKATIWRGPIVQTAVQQLLRDVHWGELDIMILDTPPGTGDVHLTLTQSVPLSGVVVVSTPQEMALIDARKSYDMFETLGVPIIGMVENMSHFQCPHCATVTPLFDTGKALLEAEKKEIPQLMTLPLVLELRQSADAGTPVALDTSSPYKPVFDTLAKRVWGFLSS